MTDRNTDCVVCESNAPPLCLDRCNYRGLIPKTEQQKLTVCLSHVSLISTGQNCRLGSEAFTICPTHDTFTCLEPQFIGRKAKKKLKQKQRCQNK